MFKDNKGLTIVELIIAIMILAIIGTAITSFMLISTSNFHSSKSESELQEEAQIALNQIEDHLIDANERVYPASENELVIENKESDGSITSKSITCDRENKQLYYSDNAGAAQPELLAEFVEDFVVTTVSTNEVNLEIQFKNGNREYLAKKNITLRNPVGKSVSPNEIDDVIPEEFVKSIVISPTNPVRAKGGSVQFSAIVKGTGKVSQAVSWTIDGNSDSTTKITNSGLLVIGMNETAKSIKVVAKSVKNPSITGSATVSVKNITGISITSNKTKFEQNMTFSLKATVQGDNLTSADQLVTWSIPVGSQFVVPTGKDTFKISAIAPVGTKVTITATSAIDKRVTGNFSFTVQKASSLIDDDDDDNEQDGDEFIEWPDEIKRGGSGTFKVKMQKGQTVSFKVTVTDKAEGKTLREGLGYTYSTTADSCRVNILKTLDYGKEATVKVVATFSGTGKNKGATRTATAPVKKVALKFGKDITSIKSNNISDVSIYYLQGKKKSYFYELEGIDSVNIDWKGSKYDRKKLGINLDKDEKKVILSVPSLDTPETLVRGEAYIGSYKLDSYIEATVAGGNIYYVLDAWSQNPRTVYTYLPLPDTDEFKDTYGSASSAVKLNQYNDVLYNSDYCDKELLPHNESDYFYYGITTETYWDSAKGQQVTQDYWYFAIKIEMNYYLQPVAGYKCPVKGGTRWEKWY